MTGLDVEAARKVLLGSLPSDPKWVVWVDGVVERLAECVEPDGWNAIMRMLGTYYPESIFPQRSRDSDWGNGPQVVSLLRLLNAAEAQLEQIRELCDETRHLIGEPAAWLLANKVRKVLDEDFLRDLGNAQ